jgi:hypothetical protein
MVLRLRIYFKIKTATKDTPQNTRGQHFLTLEMKTAE